MRTKDGERDNKDSCCTFYPRAKDVAGGLSLWVELVDLVVWKAVWCMQASVLLIESRVDDGAGMTGSPV